MKSFQRSDRVESSLKKELSILIMKEIKVNEFGLITVTDVKVSKDLSKGTIYVTALNVESENQIKSLENLLNKYSVMFENILFKLLKLRSVPKLHFVYDNTVIYGAKISALINKIKLTEKEK